MKAIQVKEPGGPERMELVEVPTPVPGPGQALVRIAATGVNFIDTAWYYGPLVANRLIVEALHPYPSDLVIATRRGVVLPAEPPGLPGVDALVWSEVDAAG